MRFLTAFSVVAALALPIVNANAEDQAPRELQGSEAMQAISGSTIIGVGSYGRVVMFIGRDHTLDVLKRGQRSNDRWSYKGDRFCIEHESHCAKVKVSGSQGSLDYDGHVFPFTIEMGNQVAAYAARGY